MRHEVMNGSRLTGCQAAANGQRLLLKGDCGKSQKSNVLAVLLLVPFFQSCFSRSQLGIKKAEQLLEKMARLMPLGPAPGALGHIAALGQSNLEPLLQLGLNDAPVGVAREQSLAIGNRLSGLTGLIL